MRPHRLSKRALPWILASGLSACTTVHVAPPDLPAVPQQFAQAPTTERTSAEGIATWWRHIPDPILQSLIEQGLNANADVRVAIARVREARTVVTQAESALYPSLSAYGGITRTHVDQVSPPGLPPPLSWPAVPLPMGTLDGSGFAAAWEVDLFGSRRSDAEAARQAALATEERLHGVQMVVAADIASAYIEARSLERRLDVWQRSLQTAQRLQRYTLGRFDAGQATRLDTDRAQAALTNLAGTEPALRTLLAARLRRLAVLTGQAPEAMITLPTPTAQAPADASSIPALLPGVLPSDVLERRPDVRGAAAAVRAYAARLGSAKAEVLPQFYFGFLSNSGRLAIGATGASQGFTTWGAGVRLPIFEGGRIQANIRASDARLEAALAQYEQAVMQALEDVENAYGARHALDARAQWLGQSWHTADDGARHAQQLFEEGRGMLQSALEARLSALQREDDLIQVHTARAQTTVMLYKAIGGGWQVAPLPPAPIDRAPRPSFGAP